LDKVSLQQRQESKDAESQWAQLKMMIDPVADSIREMTSLRIQSQKDENQTMLKQLLEFKKHHINIKSGLEELRKRVQEMIEEVG